MIDSTKARGEGRPFEFTRRQTSKIFDSLLIGYLEESDFFLARRFQWNGPKTRARSEVGLVCLVPAFGAREPQLPPVVDGADRERDWRLVLHARDLQPAAATHRTRKFCCAGAGAAGSSADFYRTDGRRGQRPHPPQAGDDRGRPGSGGDRTVDAAGALARNGLAGL